MTATLSVPLDPAKLSLWVVREQMAGLSEAHQQELARWRQAEPGNEERYQQLRLTWEATRLIPDHDWAQVLGRRKPAAPGRRHWLQATALGAAAALVGVSAWQRWGPATREFSARYESGLGEPRRIVLPDESVIHLNTQTHLAVAFYGDRREVMLHQGEALFDVHRDAGRPFFVLSEPATIRVTGTVFNVRREGAALSVVVQEGQVQVDHASWGAQRHVSLGPDQRLVLAAGADRPRVDRTTASTAMAWHTGQLVFRDTPLAEVVQELNRYRSPETAIRIVDAALAPRRVAAVLPLSDSPGLLQALPDLLPLRVQTLPSGEVLLHAR